MRCPNCGGTAFAGNRCRQCGFLMGQGDARAGARPGSGALGQARPGPDASERARRSGTLGDFFSSKSPKVAKPPNGPARGPDVRSQPRQGRRRGAPQVSPPTGPMRPSVPSMPSIRSSMPPAPPTPRPPLRSPRTPSSLGQYGVAVSPEGWDDIPQRWDEGLRYAAEPEMVESWDELLPAAAPRQPAQPMARPDDGVISGSLSGARNRAPMVPLEDMARLPVNQWVPGMPIPRPVSRTRAVAVAAGRLTSNTMLISLILLILAIPVYIGIAKLGLLNPKTTTSAAPRTLVPTPALADGFAGFQSTEFALAYPTAWQLTAADAPLSTGETLHLERFTGAPGPADTSLVVATIAAYPADLLEGQMDPIARQLRADQTLNATTAERAVTYNGIRWTEKDYQQTVVKGNTTVTLSLRVLAMDKAATSYFVIAVAPSSAFASTNASAFEPILASLRFPKG